MAGQFNITTRGPMTAADWTTLNPTLEQFEVGIEVNAATGAYEKAKIGDGRTAWADLDYWNLAGSQGVKVYRALLSQTGTDAPVETVLENTLGGPPVLTTVVEGSYEATLSGAFLVGKVLPCFTLGAAADDGAAMATFAQRVNDNVVSFKARDASGLLKALDDNGICTLTILVYP